MISAISVQDLLEAKFFLFFFQEVLGVYLWMFNLYKAVLRPFEGTVT